MPCALPPGQGLSVDCKAPSAERRAPSAEARAQRVRTALHPFLPALCAMFCTSTVQCSMVVSLHPAPPARTLNYCNAVSAVLAVVTVVAAAVGVHRQMCVDVYDRAYCYYHYNYYYRWA